MATTKEGFLNMFKVYNIFKNTILICINARTKKDMSINKSTDKNHATLFSKSVNAGIIQATFMP
jgi:hypothetical protein